MSFTVNRLRENDAKQMQKFFPLLNFIVEYNPGKFLFTEEYADVLRQIIDLEVRDDDVWVCSYLRTGSNWCQEIVWLIMNNLDFETARTKAQLYRAPLIGLSGFVFDLHDGRSVDYVRNMKSPRCIKSHEPYKFLPKQIETVKPKIIYCIRNPKDVYCSYYVFCNSFMKFSATFEEGAELFWQNKVPFGNYIDHCLPYWDKRHEPNILILFYEDMLADTKKVIGDIANFLGKPLTDEQIDRIDGFVKFDNMRRTPGMNMDSLLGKMQVLEVAGGNHVDAFLRAGKSGGWKEQMSPELSKMFDDWVERKTKGTDLIFKY